MAGVCGGSGKTIVSLGLIRALKKKGLRVRPFKKGPDYIDASWLEKAAGHEASNLDPFFMDDGMLLSLLWERGKSFDLAFIEGNRGLFDGLDVEGTCSTSHLCKLFLSPVIVVVDCTKVTRTVAALLSGLNAFEKDVKIHGVILNRVGGPRHRNILTQCVHTYTDIEVLGAIPKLSKDPIPERHMGLVSDKEWGAEESLETLARVVCENVDMDRVMEMACGAPPLQVVSPVNWPERVVEKGDVRIGVVKDSSLWFYYHENLEALERCGASLMRISLVEGRGLPEIDGLYLGGGFPETLAQELSENREMREQIKGLSRKGLPIYAECGGLMYLCKSILFKGNIYPMAGILPFSVEVCKRPQGHGYTQVEVREENPFFKKGTSFCGHEFHYSRCVANDTSLFSSVKMCLSMKRGVGIYKRSDGFLINNTFASYNHIHALHIPSWAQNFVMAAYRFKEYKNSSLLPCPMLCADY